MQLSATLQGYGKQPRELRKYGGEMGCTLTLDEVDAFLVGDNYMA
jgi:hypothetical protein